MTRDLATASPSLFSRPFLALLAMQAASGFALSTFLLLPKLLDTRFGAAAFGIGLVTASFGAMSVLAMPLMGRLIERRGSAASLVVGNLVLLVSALGSVAADGVGAFAFLRGLQGIAWTMVFNAGLTLTSHICPPGRLAQAMGIYGSANLVTNAIVPAIAEPLIDALGYRVVFGAAAVMALVAMLLARRRAGLAHEPRAPGGPREGLAGLMREPRHLRLALAQAVAGFALGTMFTFHQPFALDRGIRQVRGFFVGYTAGAIGVRLGAGRLADRFGYARTTAGALVFNAAVVALMSTLAPGRLALYGALFGVAHGLFMPAAMALAVQDVPATARGRVLTVMNGFLSGGQALVPALGAVADRAGFPIIFLGAAILLAAAVPLVPRRR